MFSVLTIQAKLLSQHLATFPPFYKTKFGIFLERFGNSGSMVDKSSILNKQSRTRTETFNN